MKERLYLDHAAATPMLAEAREAMAECFARWANPSSPHAEGRAARAALEAARDRVKAALGWAHELIFTSGATEAIGLGLACARKSRILVSPTEHDAVLRVAGDARRIEVSGNGLVDGAKLTLTLAQAEGRVLVVIQSVNSETGVRQNLADLVERVHSNGHLLLADCSQSAGKLPLPDADFIAVSAHKLGGPPGIGALLVRDLATLDALGGQERGYRPGTENFPAALGFAAALEAQMGWLDRAAQLREHLDGAIEHAGGAVVAKDAGRIATIAGYRMPGVSAAAQLIQLDLAGIAVSAGSACSSGSQRPSHVLAAMGWSEEEADEVIRVSFGPRTSRADIYRFIENWKRIAEGPRSRAA